MILSSILTVTMQDTTATAALVMDILMVDIMLPEIIGVTTHIGSAGLVFPTEFLMDHPMQLGALLPVLSVEDTTALPHTTMVYQEKVDKWFELLELQEAHQV